MTNTHEAPTGPKVHNGAYTVSHPEHGHFTVKLYTARKGKLEGERIIAILTGPNNETDFSSVAFWSDTMEQAAVWKRYRSPIIRPEYVFDGVYWQPGWNSTEQKISIWVSMVTWGSEDPPGGYWYSFGYRVQLEGRCVRCNRKLTTPESIKSGIGPICAGKAS